MSKAYIINKDGIIIDEVYVMSAHWTPRGKMVKPMSDAEDRMLVAFSEHQKKIKALLEEMKALDAEKELELKLTDDYTRKVEDLFAKFQAQEHETYIPGQLVSLMEQWRESCAMLSGEAYMAEAGRIRRKGLGLMEKLQQKKLEHLTAQSAAAAQIASMREELKELEIMELKIGDENYDANIDGNTSGALTELEKTLDNIGQRIFRDSHTQVEEDIQKLNEMQEKLNRLPVESRRVFAQNIAREMEMQRIAQRLEDSGWELLDLHRGESVQDDCSLFIQGTGERKAAIRFQLDGTVEVISHFQEDAFKTREKLQQLVLSAIEESGEKAKGKCMDGQPQPETGIHQEVAQEEPDLEGTAAALRQRFVSLQEQEREKA